MADYCKECSIFWFSKDFKNFKKTPNSPQPKKGWGYLVLCECCGNIIVDRYGRMINSETKKRDDCCQDYKCHE
jgi:hypothetical protein